MEEHMHLCQKLAKIEALLNEIGEDETKEVLTIYDSCTYIIDSIDIKNECIDIRPFNEIRHITREDGKEYTWTYQDEFETADNTYISVMFTDDEINQVLDNAIEIGIKNVKWVLLKPDFYQKAIIEGK